MAAVLGLSLAVSVCHAARSGMLRRLRADLLGAGGDFVPRPEGTAQLSGYQ